MPLWLRWLPTGGLCWSGSRLRDTDMDVGTPAVAVLHQVWLQNVTWARGTFGSVLEMKCLPADNSSVLQMMLTLGTASNATPSGWETRFI